ncbi:hypothetical protein [Immundisolibacter sp.]
MPTLSFGGTTLDMRPVLLLSFLTAGNDGYRVLAGDFARVGPQADTTRRPVSPPAGCSPMRWRNW